MRPQYLVYLNHPATPGYSVRRIEEFKPGGYQVAAHPRNIDAVRVAIPADCKRANVPVEAPIVEVWIDRSIPE